MANIAKWVVTTNLSKAYTDDKGKMHVTAIVSDNLTDLENDQMTQKALAGMVEQFKRGIDLVDNHRSTFGFGKTVDAHMIMDKSQGNPFWKVMVDVELDDAYPEAKRLYDEVKSGKCTKQLSIGGSVPHMVKDALMQKISSDGRTIRLVNRVDLDHLACTRADMAANPRTGFLSAVMKSLDEIDAFADVEPNSVEMATDNSDNQDIETTETEELTKNVKTGTNFLAQIGQIVKNGGKHMARMLKDIEEDVVETPVGEDLPVDSFMADDDQMLEDEAEMAKDVDENGEIVADDAVVADVPEDAVADDSALMEAAVEGGDAGIAPDVAPDMAQAPVETEMVVDEVNPEQPGMGDEDLEMGFGKGVEEFEGLEEDGMPEDEFSDEELELEAMKMLAKRRKMRELAKQRKNNVNINTILAEIQMLAQHTPLSKGFNPKKSDKYDIAMIKALSDVRLVLATKVLKSKDGPASIRNVARIIKEQGVFAPGGDFMDANDDKASGETDIASKNVTGADKQPEYAATAEGPKGGSAEAASVLTTAINETARLPQAGEEDKFGKSLKKIEDMLQKSVAALAKGLDEKLAKQDKTVGNLARTVDNIVHSNGISKSRSSSRLNVEKSTTNGVFTGLFTSATDKANSKM